MMAMPCDRHTLNRVIQEVLRAQALVIPCPHGTVGREFCWQCGETGPDYCDDLNAVLAALDALGLQWTRYDNGGWHVAVGPEDLEAGEWPEGIPLADGQPDTIATALVQSALRVLDAAGHTAG